MTIYYGNELYHYGAKGMHWGERRYQNKDGSLTPEGREHYGIKGSRSGNSFIGRVRGASRANREYNKNLREVDAKYTKKSFQNVGKVLTGKRSILSAIGTDASNRARKKEELKSLDKDRLSKTTTRGQLELSAVMAAVGAASYTVGRVIASKTSYLGGQIVGGYLTGAGQGLMTISAIGVAQAGADHYKRNE